MQLEMGCGEFLKQHLKRGLSSHGISTELHRAGHFLPLIPLSQSGAEDLDHVTVSLACDAFLCLNHVSSSIAPAGYLS